MYIHFKAMKSLYLYVVCLAIFCRYQC